MAADWEVGLVHPRDITQLVCGTIGFCVRVYWVALRLQNDDWVNMGVYTAATHAERERARA